MSFPASFDISTGHASGWEAIFKFGRNSAIGQEFVPICSNGIYRTPQPSGAIGLRIRSGGNAGDDATGDGARSVTLEGLNSLGELAVETLVTAGTSQSAATSAQFIRLFRVYVADSGSYASQSVPSHIGTIVIEDTNGDEWAAIDSSGFPRGQSQIGVYTVPAGRSAWITSVNLSTEANKAVDLNFYTRSGILDEAAPYSPMRLKRELVGITGNDATTFNVPFGPFSELTDIGFMARVSSQTADISIDFTLAQKVGGQ